MATVKQSERTFWHKRATVTLKTLLAMQDVSYKELSRRLESLGEDEPEKTLGNKINRGSFSFMFFLKCLYALGHHTELRFPLPPVPAEVRAELTHRKAPSNRVPPQLRKVKEPSAK